MTPNHIHVVPDDLPAAVARYVDTAHRWTGQVLEGVADPFTTLTAVNTAITEALTHLDPPPPNPKEPPECPSVTD